MTTYPTLDLSAHWTCEYFEQNGDLFEFAQGKLPVKALSAWTFERRYDHGWAAYLERRFDLPTIADIGACVNYVLHLESAPHGAKLYVNGRDYGVVQTPFAHDFGHFGGHAFLPGAVARAQPGEHVG